MAGYEKWSPRQGTERLTVFSEREREWVRYQAEMVKRGNLPHLLPVEGPPGEGILEYELTGRPLSALNAVTEEELDAILRAIAAFPEACREYLLEEGGCLTETSCLFWNGAKAELKGVYVPELCEKTGAEWVKTCVRNLLELAVEECWPEEQVLRCYRFYTGRSEGVTNEETAYDDEEFENSFLYGEAAGLTVSGFPAAWEEKERDEEDFFEEKTPGFERLIGQLRRWLPGRS